jgi:hypothetical protein
VSSTYYFLVLAQKKFDDYPMTQRRRAARVHEPSHWRKLEEDTAAGDEMAHVAEDVGLFVGE